MFGKSHAVMIVVCIVCALIVALSCGKSTSHTYLDSNQSDSLTTQGEKTDDTTTREITLDEAITQVESYEPPAGQVTDKERFEMLKKTLEEQLIAIHGNSPGKLTSSAPKGDSGKVTDLTYDRETHTLSWSYTNLGDYDQMGYVGVSDITPIANNYMARTDDGIGDDEYEKTLDGDGNGEIGIGDITAIAQNFGNQILDYRICILDNENDEPERFWWITPRYDNIDKPIRFSICVEQSRKRYFAVIPVARTADDTGTMSNLADYGGDPGSRSDWWMSGHDPQNTKRSACTGTDNPSLKWKYRNEDAGVSIGGYVVGSDGTVYYSTNYSIFACYPNGEVKWEYENECHISSYVYSNLAILSDDTVVFTHHKSGTDKINALSPEGSLIWSTPINHRVSPGNICVSVDDSITAISNDGVVLSYNADGELIWQTETGFSYPSKFSLGSDGTMLVSDDNILCAISSTGELLWTYEAQAEFASSPVQNSSGNIVFTCRDGILYCIDNNRDLLWTESIQFDSAYHISRYLLLDSDNNIYFDNYWDDEVYSYTPQGDFRWKYKTGLPGLSNYLSNFVIQNDLLYIVLHDEGGYYRVDALNLDGTQKWSYYHDARYIDGEISGQEGMFITPLSGYIVALDGNGEVVWENHTCSELYCNPTLDTENNVYFTSYSGNNHAVDSAGNPVWSSEGISQEGILLESASPVFGSNGTMYVNESEYVNAYYKNGMIKWRYNLDESNSDQVLDSDDTLYVGDVYGTLIAITSNCEEKWICDTGLGNVFYILLSNDGSIIYAVDYCGIAAVSSDGTLLWKSDLEYIFRKPSVLPDGSIWFINSDSQLIALNSDGSVRLEISDYTYLLSGLTVTEEGYVCAFTSSMRINVLDSGGNIVNTVSLRSNSGYGATSEIAIDAAGTMYLCYGDSVLRAVNPDGTEKWSFKIHGTVESAPTIGPDGTIYVCSDDGYIYAIG